MPQSQAETESAKYIDQCSHYSAETSFLHLPAVYDKSQASQIHSKKNHKIIHLLHIFSGTSPYNKFRGSPTP